MTVPSESRSSPRREWRSGDEGSGWRGVCSSNGWCWFLLESFCWRFGVELVEVSGGVGEEKMRKGWGDGEMVLGHACGEGKGSSWSVGCGEWKRWRGGSGVVCGFPL